MNRVVALAVAAAIVALAALLFYFTRDQAEAPGQSVPVAPDRAQWSG